MSRDHSCNATYVDKKSKDRNKGKESLEFSRSKIFSLVSLLFLTSIARAIPIHLLIFKSSSLFAFYRLSILAKVIAFQVPKNLLNCFYRCLLTQC